MAAWETEPRDRRGRWYHGTYRVLSPGALIIPGHSPNFSDKPGEHVYMSGSASDAYFYARRVAGSKGMADQDNRYYPHVYEVEPTGGYEPDPVGERPTDIRTRHPLRVIREVHTPTETSISDDEIPGLLDMGWEAEPRNPHTGEWVGHLPVSLLHPTEDTPTNEKWEQRGAGWDYQQQLVGQITGLGMPGPIEVDYQAGGPTGEGRSKTPRYYIRQGHHRYYAAKQLGMSHVPVTVRSSLGRPPELVPAQLETSNNTCPDCGCPQDGLAVELAAWEHAQ